MTLIPCLNDVKLTLSNFSSHFPIQASLLESILTKSFLQVLQNLQQNSEKEYDKNITHSISKKRTFSTMKGADINGESKVPNSSSLRKTSIVCKSKGRWTGNHSSLIPSLPEHGKRMANFSLEQSWKVDLKKCIDSSPLLIVRGQQNWHYNHLQNIYLLILGKTRTVIGCSHAGIVVAVDIK